MCTRVRARVCVFTCTSVMARSYRATTATHLLVGFDNGLPRILDSLLAFLGCLLLRSGRLLCRGLTRLGCRFSPLLHGLFGLAVRHLRSLRDGQGLLRGFVRLGRGGRGRRVRCRSLGEVCVGGGRAGLGRLSFGCGFVGLAFAGFLFWNVSKISQAREAVAGTGTP